MKLSSARSGLWALLTFLWATSTLAQSDFNMNFEYGFFDGVVPQTDPSEAQLSALLCETQKWLSRALQNSTGNPAVTIKALDIGYTRSTEPNTTFNMEFTGDIRTADGSPVPSATAITNGLDPLQNTNINQTQYITDYIYMASPRDDSENYFRNVDSMSYNGDYGAARSKDNTQPEARCEETMAPSGTLLIWCIKDAFFRCLGLCSFGSIPAKKTHLIVECIIHFLFYDFWFRQVLVAT